MKGVPVHVLQAWLEAGDYLAVSQWLPQVHQCLDWRLIPINGRDPAANRDQWPTSLLDQNVCF